MGLTIYRTTSVITRNEFIAQDHKVSTIDPPAYAEPAKVSKTSQDFMKHLEVLNKKDAIHATTTKKEALVKSFGFRDVIYNCEDKLVNELYHIMVMYDKPHSPETQIAFRRVMLIFFKDCNYETREFLMWMCKEFECQ